MFPWSKRRRRRELIAQPFAPAWDEYLSRNVRLHGLLPPDAQKKLRADLRVVVAEKDWTACDGLELTDEVRVTIAAQACVLALGVPDGYYFDHVKSVLVHPHDFPHLPRFQNPAGVIDEGRVLSGQAWYSGPVVVSWEQSVWGGRHPAAGRNVVFHEFAHQLDALDGAMAGVPALGGSATLRRWATVFDAEFHRLVQSVERGRPTLLDRYGATNRAEFFAVATECFFSQPLALRHAHPKLYTVLRDFYNQDPVEWPLAHFIDTEAGWL